MSSLRARRRAAVLIVVVTACVLSFSACLTHGRIVFTQAASHVDSLYNLTSTISVQQPLSCGINCLVSPNRLLVVSIGSLQRPEYLETQRATIGSLVSFRGYTEADIPTCIVCDTKAVRSNVTGGQYDRLFHGLERHRDQEDIFFEKSAGWWCAQKRNLPAVRLALQHQATLPDFMLMIDDDTFVNVPRLVEKLKFIDTSKPVFWSKRIVDSKWKPLYIMGGGGWLVSRTVLESLLRPFDHLATPYHFQSGQLIAQKPPVHKTVLEVCIEKQNGGSWCFDHSDHAVPHCIYIASQVEAHSQEDLHQEACQQTSMLPGDAKVLPDDKTWDTLLTCHYATPEVQASLFQSQVKPLL
jgi:hypothetical protein